ncbi:Integrase, catalytic core [Gossypium australe]|uniref:Integrase, catalytic core n=1 Tax=Gossypium australe TaxID=47621 RepID=A0A5B6U6M7_9ROSI|nr:Integrase, catalytic core [Gossypium australe]
MPFIFQGLEGSFLMDRKITFLLLESPSLGNLLYVYFIASDETVAIHGPTIWRTELISSGESCFYFDSGYKEALPPFPSSSHYIILSNQPLKNILGKVDISRRLSEFALEYSPQKAVKAQALANFVDKCSFSQPFKSFEENNPTNSPTKTS